MKETRELILNSGDHQELINGFIETLKIDSNTSRSYKSSLKVYATYLKDKKIDKPTEKTLAEFVYYLSEVRHCVGSTQQSYIIVIKQFYQWCYRRRLYEDISVELKYIKVESNFKRKPLSLEQAKELLRYAKRRRNKNISCFRDYVIVNLILTTGLRTIEVSRADAEDITFEGFLKVRGKGRSEKSDMVLIPSKTYDLIMEYLSKRECDSIALFVNHGNRNGGARMTTQEISKRIKKLLRGIHLDEKELSAHSLRHTAATLALEAGASFQEVQQMMRHKSLNTTMIYAHNMDRKKNKTEEKLESILTDD